MSEKVGRPDKSPYATHEYDRDFDMPERKSDPLLSDATLVAALSDKLAMADQLAMHFQKRALTAEALLDEIEAAANDWRGSSYDFWKEVQAILSKRVKP